MGSESKLYAVDVEGRRHKIGGGVLPEQLYDYRSNSAIPTDGPQSLPPAQA